jgi:hypothetical protein
MLVHRREWPEKMYDPTPVLRSKPGEGTKKQEPPK